MENRKRNIVMSLLFFAVIIAMIIGGYIYTKDLTESNKKKPKEEIKEELKDNRLDKNKEYIYFENEEIISQDPELTFKDAYLNVAGAEIINSTLKSEMDTIRKSIIYLDESNKDETKEILYNETNIYSAKERNYITYTSKGYISLVINDLDFNCYEDFLITDIKSYIVDTNNGEVLTNEEILNKYKLTNEDILDRVSLRIDETQTTKEDIEVIKKTETMNTLFDNYGFYIEGGDLYITFIVKTNFVNYNDSIKLN